MQASTIQFQADRAAGAWFQTVVETLNLIHSSSALQAFNITTCQSAEPIQDSDDERDEPWFKDECVKVEGFWKLLTELASARAWSQVQFQVCQPNALAVVLHGDTVLGQQGLRQQEAVWAAVIAAERAVATGSSSPPTVQESLKHVLQDLGWNRRECLLVCTGAGWVAGDPEVQTQARCIFSGPAQTKWELEDLFAHLASVARSSNLPTAMNKHLA